MTPLLTIRQCAERLNLSDQTVRRLILTGKITASKTGAQWRIKPEDLEGFLLVSQHQVDPPTVRSSDQLPEPAVRHFQ